jgi:hypothetical protein
MHVQQVSKVVEMDKTSNTGVLSFMNMAIDTINNTQYYVELEFLPSGKKVVSPSVYAAHNKDHTAQEASFHCRAQNFVKNYRSDRIKVTLYSFSMSTSFYVGETIISLGSLEKEENHLMEGSQYLCDIVSMKKKEKKKQLAGETVDGKVIVKDINVGKLLFEWDYTKAISKKFKAGDVVEVFVFSNWFEGVVIAQNADETYSVDYVKKNADGSGANETCHALNVKSSNIRYPESAFETEFDTQEDPVYEAENT